MAIATITAGLPFAAIYLIFDGEASFLSTISKNLGILSFLFAARVQGGGTPPELLLILKNIAVIIESTANKNIKWQINPYETATIIRRFPAGGVSDQIASSSSRVKRAFEVSLMAVR